MNSLVTLLVLTLSFLLAISRASSSAPHSENSPTSQQPSVSTAPTRFTPPTPSLSPSSFPSVPGSYAIAYPSEDPSISPSNPPETPSETSIVASPTASPSPALEEQVFISLKEWKQRKLQHIESRVRNGQARPSRSPNHSPRSITQLQMSSKHLPISFFSRVCLIHERISLANTTSESGPPNGSLDSSIVASSNAPTAKSSTTSQPDLLEPKASPSSYLSRPTSSNYVSSNSPSATVRHTNIPIRVTASQVSSNAPADELIESDLRLHSIRSGLSIPMRLPNMIPRFGSIVRSIIDASYLFSITPFPSPSSFKANTHSQNLSTSNSTSNSSWPRRKRANNRSHSSSAYPKRQPNSKINHSDRSNPVETRFVDNPVPDDVVIELSSQGTEEKPFNFASADAGARVLAHSDGVVGAKNVLIGSVDKYLLAPCDGPGLMGSRWIDLELSEDVILESIETANFEYYSSSARKVAVLGASTYPPKRWNILGVFDFQNIKSIQRFQISRRVVTRFLQVMYTGKQGDEYYCPVSTIRAFGKNLIADWKDLFEVQASDNDQVESASESMDRKSDEERVVGREARDHHHHSEGSTDRKASSFSQKGGPSLTEDANSAQRTSYSDRSEKDRQQNHASNAGTARSKPSKTNDGISQETREDASDNKIGDQSRSFAGNERSRSAPNGDHALAEEEAQDADTDLISEDDRIVMEAVRTDALAPVSGEDSIFRKVTRMLRLLELNQTLTNQYIDSQLSRFARALASTHSRSGAVSERVALVEKQMMEIVISLEARVDDLLRASFVRDVVICLLFICVIVLVGANCVLWAAISGTKLNLIAGARVIEGHSDAVGISTPFRSAQEFGSPITNNGSRLAEVSPGNKRKKKKIKRSVGSAKKEQRRALQSTGTAGNDHRGQHSRSVSSVDLVSLPLTNQTLPPFGRGAFDVLGSIEDN
ncbi:unnamed protein product [Agarophyton chilense]